jgi:hypothetical protein
MRPQLILVAIIWVVVLGDAVRQGLNLPFLPHISAWRFNSFGILAVLLPIAFFGSGVTGSKAIPLTFLLFDPGLTLGLAMEPTRASAESSNSHFYSLLPVLLSAAQRCYASISLMQRKVPMSLAAFLLRRRLGSCYCGPRWRNAVCFSSDGA